LQREYSFGEQHGRISMNICCRNRLLVYKGRRVNEPPIPRNSHSSGAQL
jgi:hypothetical protein